MSRQDARIIGLTARAAEIAADCGKTTPETVAALLAIERHAERGARAGERYDNKTEAREARKVEEIAATLGFKTEWPGLYPHFRNQRGYMVDWPR